jgi:hypothetical protein
MEDAGIISPGTLITPRIRAWSDQEIARTDLLIAAGAVALMPLKNDDEATLATKAAKLKALIASVDAAVLQAAQ